MMMSAHGEIRRMAVAPVADLLTTLALAAMAAGRKVKQWADSVNAAVEARRALAQLGALDDHMLKDIGLSRCDLRDASAVPAGADPTRFLVLRTTERRAAARLARRGQRGEG